jgi:type VI secretion system protein ImpM
MAMDRAAVGFYGKVPCRGDFVGEGLAPDFLDRWDPWLSAAIGESRADLGDRWLDAYLVAPVWRFALAPNACGSGALAGVMMASVDQVGRYFPLTVARALDTDTPLLALATDAASWFDQAEAAALSSLEDGFDFHAWGETLAVLAGAELAPRRGRGWEGIEDGLRLDLAPGDDLGRAFQGALESEWRARLSPLCLWWTGTAAASAGTLMAFKGLPLAGNFRRLLEPTAAAAGQAA